MSGMDSNTRKTVQEALTSALGSLNSPDTTWTATEGSPSGTSWSTVNSAPGTWASLNNLAGTSWTNAGNNAGTTWTSGSNTSGTASSKRSRTSEPDLPTDTAKPSNTKLVNNMWKKIAKEYSLMTYIVCQNLVQLFVYCVPVQEDARPCDVRFRNLQARSFAHAAGVFDLWQAADVIMPQLEIVKRDTERLMEHWIAKAGDRLAAMSADSYCESFMDYCARVSPDQWPQTIKDHRFFKRAVLEQHDDVTRGNVLLFGYRPLTELADAIDVDGLVALKLATAVEVRTVKKKIACADFEKLHRYRKQQFSLTALHVWVLIRLSEAALQCPGNEVPSQLTQDAGFWKVVKNHFGDLFGGGNAGLDEGMEELKLKSIYDYDFFFAPGPNQSSRS